MLFNRNLVKPLVLVVHVSKKMANRHFDAVDTDITMFSHRSFCTCWRFCNVEPPFFLNIFIVAAKSYF